MRVDPAQVAAHVPHLLPHVPHVLAHVPYFAADPPPTGQHQSGQADSHRHYGDQDADHFYIHHRISADSPCVSRLRIPAIGNSLRATMNPVCTQHSSVDRRRLSTFLYLQRRPRRKREWVRRLSRRRERRLSGSGSGVFQAPIRGHPQGVPLRIRNRGPTRDEYMVFAGRHTSPTRFAGRRHPAIPSAGLPRVPRVPGVRRFGSRSGSGGCACP